MLKSNLNSRNAWIILLALAVGMIYFTTTEYRETGKEIDALIQKEIANSSVIGQSNQGKALYAIDFGDGEVKTFQIALSEKSTVFSLLENLAEGENFKIETKEYEGMGVLVESIDGVKNGTANQYWQYWVNNELPMVAADKKEVRGGDKVEWKFGSSPF